MTDKALAPFFANAGQLVQVRDTENPMPTTASHKAPCHSLRMKSSSKVARAQSQKTTDCADRMGSVHQNDDFGMNGAVAIA